MRSTASLPPRGRTAACAARGRGHVAPECPSYRLRCECAGSWHDRELPARSTSTMIDAAIIGLGRWGKGIVQSARAARRLHFIRGVSKEPELVRDFAAEHGFQLSTAFEDALTDPRVKAVLLATP